MLALASCGKEGDLKNGIILAIVGLVSLAGCGKRRYSKFLLGQGPCLP